MVFENKSWPFDSLAEYDAMPDYHKDGRDVVLTGQLRIAAQTNWSYGVAAVTEAAVALGIFDGSPHVRSALDKLSQRIYETVGASRGPTHESPSFDPDAQIRLGRDAIAVALGRMAPSEALERHFGQAL
jgi:hypothetical protein